MPNRKFCQSATSPRDAIENEACRHRRGGGPVDNSRQFRWTASASKLRIGDLRHESCPPLQPAHARSASGLRESAMPPRALGAESGPGPAGAHRHRAGASQDFYTVTEGIPVHFVAAPDRLRSATPRPQLRTVASAPPRRWWPRDGAVVSPSLRLGDFHPVKLAQGAGCGVDHGPVLVGVGEGRAAEG